MFLGKIEIYLQDLVKIVVIWELLEGDVIDLLLIYILGFENYNDLLIVKYLLQFIGFYYKFCVYLIYGNVDVLKVVCWQEMWINLIDVCKCGIVNGDCICIFNDWGEVYIEVKVMLCMMLGVVVLGEGVWYNLDVLCVDQVGSINVLIIQCLLLLVKGNLLYINFVQVEKL